MTKGVKITLAVVIVLFLASAAAAVYMRRPAESVYVAIVQDGVVIRTIDLSTAKDQSFDIPGKNGGYNTVMISDGTICISDADCPDKTCVHTGVLRSEQVPIVCLPHRLVIRYTDEPDNGERYEN